VRVRLGRRETSRLYAIPDNNLRGMLVVGPEGGGPLTRERPDAPLPLQTLSALGVALTRERGLG
jgi:hypothetical protein